MRIVGLALTLATASVASEVGPALTATAYAQSQPGVIRIPPAPIDAAKLLNREDRSEATQKERLTRIFLLKVDGLFERYESPDPSSNKIAILVVRPSFLQIDYTMKKLAAALVYCYYYDGSDDFYIAIFDSRTEKLLGTYGPPRGLELN